MRCFCGSKLEVEEHLDGTLVACVKCGGISLFIPKKLMNNIAEFLNRQ